MLVTLESLSSGQLGYFTETTHVCHGHHQNTHKIIKLNIQVINLVSSDVSVRSFL